MTKHSDKVNSEVISTEAEILRYFPLTPDPSPRGRGAKENRRKFLLQYLAVILPVSIKSNSLLVDWS